MQIGDMIYEEGRGESERLCYAFQFQFDLETVDEEPPRGNATANPIIIIVIIIIIIIMLFRAVKIHFQITVHRFDSQIITKNDVNI